MVVIEICVILLVLIAFGVGFIIYHIETNDKSYVDKVNDVLDKSPYPILFRNPECVGYKKWNCHLATDATTGKDVLVIDID